jgi:hypothetical protein
MAMDTLSEDYIGVLKLIRKVGGTDCTGTCHHRHPGEFHCHTFGRMLNLSSQGVKNRILELLRMGLLQRERVERHGSTPLIRFVITSQGERVLASRKVQGKAR